MTLANCLIERRKMNVSDFVEKAIGPGLNVHSTQLPNDITFHVAVPTKFSLAEALVVELKRELMIELNGIDDRQQSILTNDPLLKTAQYSRPGQRLSFTISNKDLEEVFRRVCELAEQ